LSFLDFLISRDGVLLIATAAVAWSGCDFTAHARFVISSISMSMALGVVVPLVLSIVMSFFSFSTKQAAVCVEFVPMVMGVTLVMTLSSVSSCTGVMVGCALGLLFIRWYG